MILNVASMVFAALALFYWGFQLASLVRVSAGVPLLHDLPVEEMKKWPRVSVIITACNEADSLEEAIKARLTEDYPELEIILVQDRSSDSTPHIANRLAILDSRLKVVHISELPEGWLGKVHAMKRGLEEATGEWILFSDGDVSVNKGVLKRLIGYCERKGFDHCCVMPKLRPVNPLLDCLTSSFLRLVALNMRIWEIENPKSPTGAGVGAFNLVRRTSFDRTPGLEWLKMEVGDDLVLGQMMKASGARQTVFNGREMLSIEFHSSITDSFRSAERATYTSIGNFSLARLSLLGSVIFLLELAPFIALLLARTPLNLLLAILSMGVAAAAMIVTNQMWRRSYRHLILFPVTVFLFCFSMIRSGILGMLRKGIIWRGTYYSNDQLKAGRKYGKAWEELKDLRENIKDIVKQEP